MAMSMSTTYTGRVAAANPKGIRLEDQEDWLNYSKFATDIVPAERGQTVTVTVDSKGFIRTLQPLGDGDAMNGHGAHSVAGTSSASQTTSPRPAPERSGPSVRDTTITRLAVLKAAAEYAASKPESKSTDVLMIAAAWERWVTREEPTTCDLTDAF